MSGTPEAGGGPRVLDTFLEFVGMDSPTGAEGAFGAHLAAVLEAAGMEVRRDSAEERTDSECGNIIAELSGDVPGLTLVLSGHMDTVEPGRGIAPVVEGGVVRSAGETILAADDKAGLAAIVEAVRRITEAGLSHSDIRVLVTVGEEIGLQGAKALDPADALGDLCLVLDGDGTPGGIVTAAPTHFTFKAAFQGHAAHAGVEPEKGSSAIVMACSAVASMRVGRIDAETTANVGAIHGGGATNVVAASCVLTGECRSLDPEKAEAQRAQMDAAMHAAASSHGGAVNVTWTKEYDGFRFSDDDSLVALVEDACRDAGLEPRRFRTGGGSDGNVLTAKGLPSLVLSSGMRDVHGTSESVAVADLESLVDLVLAVVERAKG